MTTLAFAGREESLLPTCCLPGCPVLAPEPGEPCPACIQLWGPYLNRAGQEPQEPTLRRTWDPGCEHPAWSYRRGRCSTCGCTTTYPRTSTP